jgi:alkylated DNA repair dioxygenase AlkB
MAGRTQKDFKHQLPKTKKAKTPRINLTFRFIFESL